MHSQLQMRSLKQLINALAEMEAFGVAFVSLRDNLDLSTPSGCLMFQIFGACQTLEQPRLKENLRVRAACWPVFLPVQLSTQHRRPH